MDSKADSYIFLTGGGNTDQSFIVDDYFFDHIESGASIAYIPIALRNHTHFKGAIEWFKNMVALHHRNDLEIDVLDDLSKTINILKYKAIYIGGGNTWDLLQEILENNFDKELKKFINRGGGVLYGGSAGAIILGKDISCQRDENPRSQDSKGLNMLDDFSVECHYINEDETRIRKWNLKTMLPIIAIPEDEGVIFKNGYLYKVIGKKTLIFN